MGTLLGRIFGKKRTEQEKSGPPENFVQISPPEPVTTPPPPATPPQTTGLSAQSPMSQVIELYPGAQRALFQKYHVGGCSSCGFQPSDTLEQVCMSHGLQVDEVIAQIKESQELENAMQISPRAVAEQLGNNHVKLLDIRSPEEYEIAHIDGSVLVTESLIREIIETWPKETLIVTHCHHGIRSLDAAAYLAGHGFSQVKSMTGGIDAWSAEVDPNVPRY